jgi:hypothetical protein
MDCIYEFKYDGDDENVGGPLTEPIYYHHKNKQALAEFQRYWDKHGHGDCVEKNYALFKKLVKNNPHLRLVCKYVKYKQSGNKIFHCAVYDGDFVIDNSQRTTYVLPRDMLEGKGSDTIMTYKILNYKVYTEKTLPSLEYLMKNYSNMFTGLSLMEYGNLPRLTGKWENAKNSIINL